MKVLAETRNRSHTNQMIRALRANYKQVHFVGIHDEEIDDLEAGPMARFLSEAEDEAERQEEGRIEGAYSGDEHVTEQ